MGHARRPDRPAAAAITARGLLGIAGAAVLPSTLALIGRLFTDPRQRSTVIAMWVTALSAGIALGPVAGGTRAGSTSPAAAPGRPPRGSRW